jgi:hypothetical protein
MLPAPVQGPAFVATLRSSFSSLFSRALISVSVLVMLFSSAVFSQEPANFSPGIHDGIGIDLPDSIKFSSKRKWIVGGLHVAAYGGSLILLNSAWYKKYPHTAFHTFNDTGEWLQVDKFGHAWSAYNTGKASAALWRWTGMDQKKAALVGGVSGAAYLTVIEFLDAHSAKWGWSWGDIGANIFGSGLFISQELIWKEQRIQYKFSFHHKSYSPALLADRADDLFGKTWYERMLKDYNAQTYWFSVNMKSFFKTSRVPPWLNVSLGYGGDGMFGGFENTWLDKNGNPVSRKDIPRTRQFYMAPDIDFTKIHSRKKWVRTTLWMLNAFKCPAPSLMIDAKGKVKFFPFYF